MERGREGNTNSFYQVTKESRTDEREVKAKEDGPSAVLLTRANRKKGRLLLTGS